MDLQSMSIYNPRYQDCIDAMSQEEREDFTEDEQRIKRGFYTLIALQYKDAVDESSISLIDDAIYTYDLLGKFLASLQSCEKVSLDCARQQLDRAENDSEDYWNAYGRLKFLLRNIHSVVENASEYGNIFVKTQSVISSVRKMEVFSDVSYPQSFAVVYKLSGESKFTNWMGRVLKDNSSIKSNLFACDCFAEMTCETSLEDCFLSWVVDPEIIKYVGDCFKSIMNEGLRLIEQYVDGALYLTYMDLASTYIFEHLLRGEDVSQFIKESRLMLAKSPYQRDFDNIVSELIRRSKSLEGRNH